MKNGDLYDNGKLKITYLHSPEPGKEDKIISHEDHELWIKDNGEWNRYIIPMGILKELVLTSQGKSPLDLSRKLMGINEGIFHDINKGIANLDDIMEAFASAYRKQENDFEKYLAEQKMD